MDPTNNVTPTVATLPWRGDEITAMSALCEVLSSVAAAMISAWKLTWKPVSRFRTIRLLGIVRRFRFRDGNVSKGEADMMAEHFVIWQGHFISMYIAAKVLQEEEKAFLEHREPNRNMSEKIHNQVEPSRSFTDHLYSG